MGLLGEIAGCIVRGTIHALCKHAVGYRPSGDIIRDTEVAIVSKILGEKVASQIIGEEKNQNDKRE